MAIGESIKMNSSIISIVGNSGTVGVEVGEFVGLVDLGVVVVVGFGDVEMETEPSAKFIVCVLLQPLCVPLKTLVVPKGIPIGFPLLSYPCG